MTPGTSFVSRLSGLCMLGKQGKSGRGGASREPLALGKPSQDMSTAQPVGWKLPAPSPGCAEDAKA